MIIRVQKSRLATVWCVEFCRRGQQPKKNGYRQVTNDADTQQTRVNVWAFKLFDIDREKRETQINRSASQQGREKKNVGKSSFDINWETIKQNINKYSWTNRFQRSSALPLWPAKRYIYTGILYRERLLVVHNTLYRPFFSFRCVVEKNKRNGSRLLVMMMERNRSRSALLECIDDQRERETRVSF